MTMQTCIFFVEKGGAAKTATSCQYGHYLAASGKRVLFIDLDSQEGRASVLMKKLATGVSAYKVFQGDVTSIEPREDNVLTLVEGERALQTLEKQVADHNKFISNFRTFLKNCADKFDYCIIDCPPGADIRVKAALICGDFVVSPVKLAQEHVLGVGPVLGLINLVKEKMNPNLVFLGLLITMFESKPLQKHWFTELATKYAKLLIGTKIKNASAIQEAQQMGIAVAKINKTTAKEVAKELAAVFDVLTEKMEAHNA